MFVLKTLVLGAASAGVVSALALPSLPRLEQIHLLEQQQPVIPKLAELFLPPNAPRPSKSAPEVPPPVVPAPAPAPAKEDKTTTTVPPNKHAHSPETLPPHIPHPAQPEKNTPVSTPNDKNANSQNSPAQPQTHHISPPHIFNQQCLFMPHTHSSHFTVPPSIIAPRTWIALSSQLHTTVSSMLTKPTHRRRNLMETIHLGFTLEDRSLENVFLGVTYTRHSEKDRVQEEVKNELEEEMAELAERQILGCLGEATRALREPGMGMMEGGWEVPDGRGRVSFLIWRID